MSRQLFRKLLISLTFLIPILLFQNCGLVRPAEVLDTSSTSPKFEAAKAVLQRHCADCHGPATSMNLSYSKEQDFISSGMVVAGNIDLSKMIYRTRNYTGPTAAARDMPPSSSLSTEEYQALVDWVSDLSNASSSATGD